MSEKAQLLLVLTAGLLGLLGHRPVAAEPFVPSDESQVLERLPIARQADAKLRELRRLRSELSDDAGNLELALRLARGYMEVGRSAGDPRYMGYAQASLAAWWDLPSPPPGVLLLRAIARQNRHDFDGALDDLNRLLRLEPRNARAWFNRAVIQQVQGDHGAALASCRPLRRVNYLLAAACEASAASLSGDAERSYDLLQRALAAFPAARTEDRLWALTGLAEIAVRLGREKAAERHFEAALALDPRDLYLLAAYSDFLLDQDRPRAVTTLLAEENRSDALLLRRALAAARLDAPRSDDLVASLEARFAEGRLRGDSLHLGSESRFRLHLLRQPDAALRLALENWAVQREPVDARYVLEAALAAGDVEAAGPVIAWRRSSGLEDVRLAALEQRIEEVER